VLICIGAERLVWLTSSPRLSFTVYDVMLKSPHSASCAGFFVLRPLSWIAEIDPAPVTFLDPTHRPRPIVDEHVLPKNLSPFWRGATAASSPPDWSSSPNSFVIQKKPQKNQKKPPRARGRERKRSESLQRHHAHSCGHA